jgi:hypothetical protein
MKEKVFKYATAIIVILLIVRPDTIMLAFFIDSVGLELFLLLLGIQFRVFSAYLFVWLSPIFDKVYNWLQRQQNYFFIPSYTQIKQKPSMLSHAIPGYGLFLKTIWLIRSNPHV